MKKIDKFRDEYRFLSNFYPCDIKYQGLQYLSTEAAYQAAKCKFPGDRKQFTSLTPGQAKRKGRQVTVVADWNKTKYKVMYDLLMQKFAEPTLKNKLLMTNPSMLIEGNHWHDNDWGDCACERCKNIEGKNRLGKMLMDIRHLLRSEK